MEQIRQRIRQYRDDIESAEQREYDAKLATRGMEENLSRLEGEKTTLLNRISVIGSEIEKINSRLDEANEKLEEITVKKEESEVKRLELADTEIDGFERTEEIAHAIKTTAETKENAQHLVVEAERRIVVLENDLERANERLANSTEIVEKLKETIAESSEYIRDLEEKDRDASEREDIGVEKAKFLETQLHESVSTAEVSEREARKLERLRDQLITEIDGWKMKKEDIKDQMEREMGSLLEYI